MAQSASVEDYIIDFSKEEKVEGGPGVHIKKGVYKVKFGKAKPMRSQNKGTLGLSLPFIIVEGPQRKTKMTERLWVSPKAYGRFRDLLEAVGKKVPNRVDLRKIAAAVVGEECYVNIVDETSEGYDTKSVISFQGGFISIDDYEDGSDDSNDDDDLDGDLEDDEDLDDLDEEPKRKTKAKRKAAPVDDDDEDDLDSLDLDDF